MLQRNSKSKYRSLVADSLKHSSGTTSLQDIYRWVEESGRLNEEDFDMTPYGEPLFWHRIRGALMTLRKDGEVERVGRALYRWRSS